MSFILLYFLEENPFIKKEKTTCVLTFKIAYSSIKSTYAQCKLSVRATVAVEGVDVRKRPSLDNREGCRATFSNSTIQIVSSSSNSFMSPHVFIIFLC